MSLLRVYSEDGTRLINEFSAAQDIAGTLRSVHIRFERWNASEILRANATPDEILQAYDQSLQKIKKEVGFVTADVIAVQPDLPNINELRKKFLDEHAHSEDEARFFVEGCGIFYIHPNANVFVLVCEKGDFIDIPANTKHWFDMGPRPSLKAIRTFNTPDGWVASFTGSGIAAKFPRFEQIVLPV